MKTLGAILDAVRGRRGQREAVVVNDYASAVVAVADGRDVDPALVDELMAKARRTEEKFRQDVERVVARRELLDKARALPKLRAERMAADESATALFQTLEERIWALRQESNDALGRARDLQRAEDEALTAVETVLSTAPPELASAYRSARDAVAQAEEELVELQRFARGEFAMASHAETVPRTPRLQAAWLQLRQAYGELEAVKAAHSASQPGIGFESSDPRRGLGGRIEPAQAAFEHARKAVLTAAQRAVKELAAQLAELRLAEEQALKAALSSDELFVAQLALGQVR